MHSVDNLKKYMHYEYLMYTNEKWNVQNIYTNMKHIKHIETKTLTYGSWNTNKLLSSRVQFI